MAASVFLKIFCQPFNSLPLPPDNAFDGATAVVTGGNTGLGLETARHLVNLGATRVIIASRNIEKGNTAKQDIEATTSRKGVLEVWELDMSSFENVKRFAARVNALPSLDLIFLNAGIATMKYAQSPDGWEQTLQVNVLSTALLALLVLPKLVQQGKEEFARNTPHVVITSSGLHCVPPFKESTAENVLNLLNDKANFESKPDPVEQYMLSKLLDVYITKELARLVPGVDAQNTKPAVIVNTIDPGLCKSELQREGPPLPLKIILAIFGRPTPIGSRTLIDAATKGSDGHGKYFINTKVAKPGRMVISPEGQRAQEAVWAEISKVLVQAAPEIRATLDGQF